LYVLLLLILEKQIRNKNTNKFPSTAVRRSELAKGLSQQCNMCFIFNPQSNINTTKLTQILHTYCTCATRRNSFNFHVYILL